MDAQFSRSLLIGLGLLALVACTPMVTPATGTTPEIAATSLPESEAATVAPTTAPSTSVTTAEAEEEPMTLVPATTLAGDEVAALAVADLAERLTISVNQIQVREVRAVTWPDASLGCPQPDTMYAQVVQEGFLIRLSVGAEMYFYHSGSDQKPFLCQTLSDVAPHMTPKVDELLPPPGSDID